MSTRVLPLLLLPVFALGLVTAAEAAPRTDLDVPAPFAAGSMDNFNVTAEDDYYIEYTKDNGDGTKTVHTRSKKTGYWTTRTHDSNGNSQPVGEGNGDGEVQEGVTRPAPTPMDGYQSVVYGPGWTRTTLNNPDGTAIIHTQRDNGTWRLRIENAQGVGNIVAIGDGQGNISYP